MLRAAEARYRAAARLAAASATIAGQLWEKVPVGNLDSWRPELLASRVAALQLLVARGAEEYVASVLAEQDIDPAGDGRLNPAAFAAVAGDGRSLATLLDEPRIAAKTAIGRGRPADLAWEQARNSLRLMSVTAVQDAGRAADSVALAHREHVSGYVRMLNTPSCSRCVILAGKFFRWNAGFARHPKCDCRHIPSNEDVAGDLRTDPLLAVKSGQVTGLSRADARAILEDGADVGQVINAHRGMATADVFSRRLKVTREGVTVRSAFGKASAVKVKDGGRYSRAATLRLRPESIYRLAGDDRQEALRLLRRFGYLL